MRGFLSAVPAQVRDAYELERGAANLERARWASLVLVVLHVAHVVAFGLRHFDDAVQQRWQVGVVAAHAFALAFSSGVFLAAWLGRGRPLVARWVPAAMSLVYLGLGAWFAANDQVVTTAITPLVAVHLGTALMFRMSPVAALLQHAAGAVLFGVLQPFFQGNEVVRITNVSNASTMAVLSAMLSVVFTVYGRRDFVQRRTIERQNAELEAAFARMQGLAERAEAASTAKSVFLATMSHEIRTPLNGVLGVAELLRAGPLDVEQRRLLGAITEAGGTLLTLINDLLDFSKIEAGQMSLEALPVDVAALVDEVRGLHAPKAGLQGLQLEARCEAPGHTWLRCDPTRLKQVMGNLVGNAVKFTERGGVTLVVRLVPDGAWASLECRVTDTGIGLDEAQRSKLFAPFVQADASTTRRHGGTGLGLAICKRLVEQQGGSIGVESVPGEGSTFWFTMRLPTCAPVVAAPVPASQAAFTARVLLAEDNPVNVLVARGMLSKLGVQVVVARDGREALALLQHEVVDLVLTDLHMPELDGFSLAKELRASGFARPIIAVTADALPEDRQRCLDVGMDDYVAKPFRATDLERVLGRWAAARRAA